MATWLGVVLIIIGMILIINGCIVWLMILRANQEDDERWLS